MDTEAVESASWTAVVVGIVIAIVGALFLMSAYDDIDAVGASRPTIRLVLGWLSLAVSGMFVQGGIVGLIVSSRSGSSEARS